MTIFTDNFDTVARNVKMGGVKSLDIKWSWRFFKWLYVFEIETPQF